MTDLQTFSHQLADAVDRAGQTIVAVNARRRRSSSGIHWRSNIIVTADHAIQRDEDVTVTLPNGSTIAATIAGRDSGTDIAVLSVDGIDLPTAQIAAHPQKVGELVLAIARNAEGSVSASMGIISAMSNGWRSWRGGRVDQLIRPSLMLYPGFSGGALVNAQGQIIGMNTSGARHMPLTIPATTLDRVVDQLLQKGRIARGYLGLGMQAIRLPDPLRQSLNLSSVGGVIVVSVEPDAPAERGGVLLGDIIIALDNHEIEDVSDIHSVLEPEKVGQPVIAKIIRGGRLMEVTIVVGERPGRAC
jgi:S1-C subfamily serine protease